MTREFRVYGWKLIIPHLDPLFALEVKIEIANLKDTDGLEIEVFDHEGAILDKIAKTLLLDKDTIDPELFGDTPIIKRS